jgi:hypothetical protein
MLPKPKPFPLSAKPAGEIRLRNVKFAIRIADEPAQLAGACSDREKWSSGLPRCGAYYLDLDASRPAGKFRGRSPAPLIFGRRRIASSDPFQIFNPRHDCLF